MAPKVVTGNTTYMLSVLTKDYLSSRMFIPLALLLGMSLLTGLPELGLCVIGICLFVRLDSTDRDGHDAFARVIQTLKPRTFQLLSGAVALTLSFSAGFVDLQLIAAMLLVLMFAHASGWANPKIGAPQKACGVKDCGPVLKKPAFAENRDRPKDSPCGRLEHGVEKERPEVQRLDGLAAELQQHVTSCLPRDADNPVLKKLTRMGNKCLLPVVPEAEITTVAYVNLRSNDAEANTKDADCHMVLTVDPQILSRRIHEFFVKSDATQRKDVSKLSAPELKKYATKVLSERLTFVRFWRSQYSGPDPMVVYIVPINLAGSRNPIRLNFSVNCVNHLRFSTVVSKATLRTKELITFVAEWAKRRGIANTVKGHSPPYAWCLMSLYFMRYVAVGNGPEDSGSLMDTLHSFVKYLLRALAEESKPLCMCFNAPCKGRDDEQPAVKNLFALPFVEDPFEPNRNVAHTVTHQGVVRVREELNRLDAMLSDGNKSFADLLERWVGQPSTSGSGAPEQAE